MLEVNLKNYFAERLGEGITQKDIESNKDLFMKAKEKFLNAKQNLGFTRLPYVYADLEVELKKAENWMEGKDTLVIIGIGGSDLGTRALHRALNHQFYNQKAKTKIYFTGDTTDSEAISDLVDILDLSKTLFLVVSKSGNTIEQGSVFVYVKDLLEQKALDPVSHIAFLTDPEKGTLRELAQNYGYRTADIPSDVGGRFSVLSTVGMIPAHLVGLNVEKFLEGARDFDKEFADDTFETDQLLHYIAAQYLYYKQGKTISVMMPYMYSLYEFAKWYQQLWAESLGKKLNSKGETVNEGVTPIATLGPTDQHSQLQLFNEGPNNKVFTLISAEESRKDIKLPENYKGVTQYDFLKGRTFHEILNYEMQTTAFALTKNQRPNATITVPVLDEYHLGQLFYFYEVAVTIMGYLLDINPFDQPGVELSKNAMYGILGKAGYENEKDEFDKYLGY